MLDLLQPQSTPDGIDALTGALDRTGILGALDKMLEENNDRSIAVLLADLDEFSLVTSSFGHVAADHLLREVADRLRSRIRPEDVFGRFGGDQFVVLAPGIEDPDDAIEYAGRLQDGLVETIYLSHASFAVRASVGVTISDEKADAARLLRDAVAAIQEAKRSGRGQTSFFDESLRRERSRRLELAADLSDALGNGQFSLDFQPICDLKTRSVIGAEAFVRWDHPRLGRLSPGEFLSVAVDSGAMHRLGEWIIDAACQAAAELTRHAGYDVRISVNFSGHELAAPGLAERIKDSLGRHKLQPSNIGVEITEVALQDADAARATVATLAEMGLEIALDDFGTAYSSLNYLRQVKAGTIKLAGDFAGGAVDDEPTRAIIESIVHLADKLGITLVAHRLENDEQADAMAALGVHSGQGYVLGKPVTLAEFKAAIKPQR